MYESGPSQTGHSRLPPGTRLNGIFEIDQAIATGGMGEIYRGHAVETNDPVAIKVMRTDLADNAMILALFRKEASALHNIQHDAVVRYYIFTSDPVVRRHYLAMEFIDGRVLEDRLREGPLTFEAVRQLQQRLAAGLHAVHQHGIVHRDISPDNILIPNGDVARAKIIDFGIARLTQRSDGTIIGGGFAGKYGYVSPEQLGLFGGNVTPKSDIYSLGLVLAECLSGRKIDMGGSQFDVIEKRRMPPNLGAVDLRYRPLLEHMLQPDPADRPESMAVIAAWRPDIAYRAPPPPVRGRGQGAPERNTAAPATSPRRIGLTRNIAIAALALVILAGLGSVGFFFLYRPAPVRVAEPPTLAPPQPVPPSANLGPALGPPSSTNGPGLLPNSPPPSRMELAEDAMSRIQRYVSAYQDGDCFFAAPAGYANGRATVDAYAAAAAAFDNFVTDFRRANGIDANLNPHRINQSQCPAITFLSRLRGSPGSAPRLEDVAASLRSGDTLRGTLAGAEDKAIDLLLIADDGLVYNITSLLRPGAGGNQSFGLVIKAIQSGPPKPQLIMAVASVARLAAFKSAQNTMAALGVAGDVLVRAMNEARQSGQLLNVGIKYFQLEN
jgi:serine/threonine protein kinase